MKKQLSYADRAKALQKKFEGRNSPEALLTFKSMMQDLRDEQEMVKNQLHAERSPGMSLDEYNQTNQAFLGALFSKIGGAGAAAGAAGGAAGGSGLTSILGQTGLKAAGATELTGGAQLTGAEGLTGEGLPGGGEGMLGKVGMNNITDLVSGAKGLFGKSKIDQSGEFRPDVASMEKSNTANAISGGVDTVSKFASGDIVGGITGAVKTIGGFFGGKKDLDAANEALANNDQAMSNKARPSSYATAYGGLLPNQAGFGDLFRKVFKGTKGIDSEAENVIDFGKINETLGNIKKPLQNEDGTWNRDVNASVSGADEVQYGKDTPIAQKSPVGKALDWTGKNLGNITQYAPALGALTNKIDRVHTQMTPKIEGQVDLDRMDERRLIKEIRNTTNVAGSAKEGSGGSLSLYNELAKRGELNKIKGVGKGYSTMMDSNLGQQLRETQLQEQRNYYNAQAHERFQERERQDEGAYQTAKQQNRAAIFENIGNIGREETDKKIVKEMYGYKWNGKYWSDGKGNRVSDAEYNDLLKKNNTQLAMMFGGYLKR